ncbi:MAG: hypothetical protein HQ526_10925 [Actinobacteria bacterium]|nr:hypothetical protein [Actinomycetota bacterium]
MSADSKEIPEYMREVVVPMPTGSAHDIAVGNALILNETMLQIYERGIVNYQQNLLETVPIIVARFSGEGGAFDLYRPGQAKLTAPQVPITYQVLKSVGHSSMATYQLVVRYTSNPENPEWRSPLRSYREQHRSVLETIGDLEVSDEQRTVLQSLLSHNLEFMDSCLNAGTFDAEMVTVYAQNLKGNIATAIGMAGEIQVSHWMAVLDEWKQLLGADWEKAYGVVNALYVARTNNILFTVMAQYFGEHAINDRLVLFETSEFETTSEKMLDLLTRIVSDRVLGKIFFDDYFLMDYELLSTGGREAIERGVAEREAAGGGVIHSPLKRIAKEAEERLGEALMPPLAPFHSWDWPWRTGSHSAEGPRSLAETDHVG